MLEPGGHNDSAGMPPPLSPAGLDYTHDSVLQLSDDPHGEPGTCEDSTSDAHCCTEDPKTVTPKPSQAGTVTSTRSGRQVRFPMRRFEDFLPSGQSSALSDWMSLFPEGEYSSDSSTSPSPPPPPDPLNPEGMGPLEDTPVHDTFDTPSDAFGLFRTFRRIPQRDPEIHFDLDTVCDAAGIATSADNHLVPVPDVHDADSRFGSIAWLTPRPPDTREDPAPSTFGPFGESTTQFRLIDWFYGRGSEVLSFERFDDLLDIIQSNGFTPAELEGFSARKAERMIEAWVKKDDMFRREHGWLESVVYVPMPCVKYVNESEEVAPKYEVRGLHHRDIVDLVVGCMSDKKSRFRHSYHWVPSQLFWVPPVHPGDPPASPSQSAPLSDPNSPSMSSHQDKSSPPRAPTPFDSSRPASSSPPASAHPKESSRSHTPTSSTSSAPEPIRVYTDCYNSDAMLAEDEKIRTMDRIPGDDPAMEYAILPILIWSDETVLSSFGSASLWPIYLYFGNMSKYIRGRPTEFAAHHLAYIPSVSNHMPAICSALTNVALQIADSFADHYESIYHTPPSAEVVRFCRRELFTQIWLILLNDKFMRAFNHGVVAECGDSVTRRMFFRIFTYSADYMEKYDRVCSPRYLANLMFYRVKILALKPNSTYMVPFQITRKDQLWEAGMPNDVARRAAVRQDDPETHLKIASARRMIFEQGYSIAGAPIKDLLKEHSLTPTQVSSLLNSQVGTLT